MSESRSGQPGETAATSAANAAPPLVGDVVFGNLESPVAVCTLGSRSLLADLVARPEIAIAGRVFTENVGIERMVQNVAGMTTLRVLVVCGRETPHAVGQTILALHANGLDADHRVIGSTAPEPFMPNLRPDQLRTFQRRVQVVDMIGELDPATIIARSGELAASVGTAAARAEDGEAVRSADRAERIKATLDQRSAWEYDPIGYFLVFVDRPNGLLRVEHYNQRHELQHVVEGAGAAEIGQTLARRGLVTLLAHAVYLGRELGRAESALRLNVDYEQDRPLMNHPPMDAHG
ncbi:MAG: DUF4346 domain-containing protein [Chloroflexi bacterium]|nr:DUF4346 domain-containing protein [Chloroflexota bacterium]